LVFYGLKLAGWEFTYYFYDLEQSGW